MSIDSVGNSLTIIRNGILASKAFVLIRHSNMSENIVLILKTEGFIIDYDVVSVDDSLVKKSIKVFLKYVDGESVIHEIKRVSTPGCRVYSKVKNLKPVVGGMGISILSTSNGVITDKQAKNANSFAGGEILCRVW